MTVDISEALGSSNEEAKDNLKEASEDEIIQFVISAMLNVEEMMKQANAAVHSLNGRVTSLEKFMAYFIRKDPSLAASMMKGLVESEGRTEEEKEALLKSLKAQGVVGADAELLKTESEENAEAEPEEDNKT